MHLFLFVFVFQPRKSVSLQLIYDSASDLLLMLYIIQFYISLGLCDLTEIFCFPLVLLYGKTSSGG